MTAQEPDSFIYNNRNYHMVAYSAEEPINPASLGFEPVGLNSDCWRGYISVYSIDEDKRLILKHLYLGLYDPIEQLGKPIQGKPIGMVSPVTPDDYDDEFFFLNNHYKDVDLIIDYGGGILIGNGFIDELYEHMGFHPAWKYGEVHL